MDFEHYPQFFTATILNWEPLLAKDEFKDIIVGSFRFLKNEGSVIINAFVIMDNHFHVIWRIQNGFNQKKIQMRLLKFTAQKMKFKLLDTNDPMLQRFLVNAKDRKYQFWERNPLSIELVSEKVFIQKLNYLHNNPSKYFLNTLLSVDKYKYSSAKFYETGIDDFDLLTHYMD